MSDFTNITLYCDEDHQQRVFAYVKSLPQDEQDNLFECALCLGFTLLTFMSLERDDPMREDVQDALSALKDDFERTTVKVRYFAVTLGDSKCPTSHH